MRKLQKFRAPGDVDPRFSGKSNQERQPRLLTKPRQVSYLIKRRNSYKNAPSQTTNVWAKQITSITEIPPGNLGENNAGFNLEDEIRNVLGMDSNELQRLTMEFISEYQKLTTISEKREAQATHYLRINQWRP